MVFANQVVVLTDCEVEVDVRASGLGMHLLSRSDFDYSAKRSLDDSSI